MKRWRFGIESGFLIGCLLLSDPATATDVKPSINIKVESQSFSQAELVSGQIQSQMASIKDLCSSVASLIGELQASAATKPDGSGVKKDSESKLSALTAALQKAETALTALEPNAPAQLAPKLKSAVAHAKAAQATRAAAQAAAKILIELGPKPADPEKAKQWATKRQGALGDLTKAKQQTQATALACVGVAKEAAALQLQTASDFADALVQLVLFEVQQGGQSSLLDILAALLAENEAKQSGKAKASLPKLDDIQLELSQAHAAVIPLAAKPPASLESKLKSAAELSEAAKSAALGARAAAGKLASLGPKPTDGAKAKQWAEQRKAALDELTKAQQKAQQVATKLKPPPK